jgi:beta-N-acetylhexosaminidase
MRPAVLPTLLLLAGCTTTRLPAVDELTLDDKVGQMFVTVARGVYMSESSPSWRELERQVRDLRVGGVIWRPSDVYETAFLASRLQSISRIPLLFSADVEAGIGMRFSDTTFWPPAMALAATGDVSLAERQGRVSAREARALGISQIYAPVADVNVNPDNPVINVRSFSEDPAEVARFVEAFIRGCQSEGVMATAKHFPGHGDTRVDSHLALPVLPVDRERLEAVELAPFRAAVRAGVASIMIGHLAVPSIDPTAAPIRDAAALGRENRPYVERGTPTEGAALPATVSPLLVDGLLRRDLGFDGLVVTDAFDMEGLAAHFDDGEGAVRAIEAGVDQILMPVDAAAAIAGVKAAVRSGRLPESRIDESVRRILATKARFPAAAASQEEIFRTVDREESRLLAEEIARRSLTLLRDRERSLPLRSGARTVVLTVNDVSDGASPVPAFEEAVERLAAARSHVFRLDPRSDDQEAAAFLEEAGDAEVVIIALALRARTAAGQIELPVAAKKAIEGVLAAGRSRVVAVSFGSPYILRDLPGLPAYLCAWGAQPVLQSAAARALYGEAPVGGRAPVTIPGLHARGEGLDR